MLERLTAGIDLPGRDPARDHNAPMEGYYWRFTDADAGRVVIVLCGVCAAPGGRWAVVALAAHPEGLVREAIVPLAGGEPSGFGVRAGDVLRGSLGALRVDLGPEARLDVRLNASVAMTGRALGVGHLLPGLPQYWQPSLLGARVEGEARLGDATVPLTAATAYVERNWGPRFPDRWWWGQAQGFEDDGVCVAFAGGPVLGVPATAVVVRAGGEVLRFPLAAGRDWSLRARSPRYAVTIEGDGAGRSPAILPVPVPSQRRVEPRSEQWLAGRLALTVRRGRRIVFRGESALAGLERGTPRSAEARTR